MSNYNVSIVGSANVTQMSGAFAKLEGQVAHLNAQLEKMVVLQNGVDPSGYQRMTKAAAANSNMFRNAAASTGMFQVQQLKVNSATEEYTRMLQKQQLSFRTLAKQSKIARAAYKEQLAMQNMVVRQNAGGSLHGKNMLDVIYPKEAHKNLDTLGNKIGWVREQTRSASTQMVNWGKNTQWAGRQLMVGLTMPVAAFAAAAGVLAYNVDKQLTRIQKVYDTTADSTNTSVAGMAAVERELMAVREAGIRTAEQAARQYGASASDTLDVQAELAATGQKGAELQGATIEVMRVATLGEMEYADALQATITLQSVFRMSNTKLAESFNYMNAVENATSLQLKDFSTAIPIAAAAVKQMGGDVQDLGILLTAMKERGIEATQGANAIKALQQRLYRPSKQIREEFSSLTGGANITDIVEESDSLIEILTEINHLTRDMSKVDQTKVFAGLFGSYQVTRMSALVAGMGDLEMGIGQVSAASRLAEQDTDSWASAAARETKRLQESVSGQFKIALETIKIELAQMGEPFVAIATGVIKGLSRIIAFFNGLPDAVKKGLGVIVTLMALAGPVIMLAGLFGNLGGMVLKMFVGLTGLATKFQLIDKESRAAALAAELASSGFVSEGTAVRMLTAEIEKLTLAMGALTTSQQRQQAAAMGGLGMPGVLPTKYIAPGARTPKPLIVDGPDQTGGKHSTGVHRAGGSRRGLSDFEQKVQSGGRGSALGGGMLVAAGAMAAMAVSSNETVDSMASMVMYAALLAPIVTMLPWKAMSTGIVGATTKLRGSFLPIIGRSGASMGALVTKFAMGFGPAGIAVAAVATMAVLYSKINDNAEALERMNDTAEDWSKIFGYSAREPGTLVDEETGEVITALSEKVRQLNKAAPEVGEAIEKAMDQAGNGMSKAAAEAKAMNIAIRQGLQVINTGGSAAQAREAVETSLMAGVKDATAVADLMAEVDIAVDFNVKKDVMKANLEQTMNQIKTSVHDKASKGTIEAAFDLTFGLTWTDSEESKQAVYEAAETFYDSWEMATESNKIKMIRYIQRANEEMRTNQLRVYMADDAARGVLEKHDITNGSEFLKASQTGQFSAKELQILQDTGLRVGTVMTNIEKINKKALIFVHELAKAANLDPDAVDDFEDILGGTIAGYKSAEEAAKAFNQQLAGNALNVALGVDGAVLYTDQQKLQILNAMRLERGQKRTGRLLDGFGLATVKWDKSMEDVLTVSKKQTVEMAKQQRIQRLMRSVSGTQIKELMQNAMSSFQQEMADDAMSTFTDSMDDAMDGLEANAERRTSALERQQERASRHLENQQEKRRAAIERSFDKRIENIDKTIEAEQKADDIRQRLFDAEMQRLDRLNESANRNIDFNVALNEGNLDEAAKIRNDMQAQASDWALSDASKSGEGRSDRRRDRLEGKADGIENNKDRRLAALDKIEEREKRALENTQERRKKALDLELKQERENAEKKWEVRQKYLEESLDDFTGYIATSDKDLRKHIKIWEAAHKGLSINTSGRFATTAANINKYIVTNVSDAARELVNGNEWDKYGIKIGKDIMNSAFGLTTQQFRRWMVTGVFPKGGGKPPTMKSLKDTAKDPWWATTDAQTDRESRHEGGEIGSGSGSRKGYARTSPMNRNETNVLAERGEFMVKKDMASKHRNVLEQINSGNFGKKKDGMGGSGIGMGVAGIMGAMMVSALKSSVGMAAITGATNTLKSQAGTQGTFTAAKSGKYGDREFSEQQLGYAATISSVGASMGMSARDIRIGIMTAITESGLSVPNQANSDRDSAGLFQQRPSQGWGSVAQVMDPTYAATEFFQALQSVGDRGDMSPWMAAQSVQRSAYSDGSNYRQYWDEAQAIYSNMARVEVAAGKGGWNLPISGRTVGNTHAPGAGSDISVGTGTPVRAVYDGTVMESRDILGRNPYSNDGYASYGKFVKLRHELPSGPAYSLYAHLNRRRVGMGSNVKGGTVIGSSGSTGNSSGPHLHFEVGNGLSSNSAAYPGSFLEARGLNALSDGGMTLSDGMAMLHRGETVLTADLTNQLHEGIGRFANGGESTYNVKVYVTNPSANADDIAQKVVTTLRRMEQRRPQSRKK